MTDTAAKILALGHLENLVGYQLRRAFLRSNQLFARLGGEAGLAPGQYGVLQIIALNPGRSQTDVAQAAGLDRSSLTQMLDQLTARGFVERRPGPDRRTVSLHLSPAGVGACVAGAAKAREHETIIRGDLSEAEARQLTQLLQRIQG